MKKYVLSIKDMTTFIDVQVLEGDIVKNYIGLTPKTVMIFDMFSNTDDIMKESGHKRTEDIPSFDNHYIEGSLNTIFSSDNIAWDNLTWYYCELGTYDITKRKANTIKEADFKYNCIINILYKKYISITDIEKELRLIDKAMKPQYMDEIDAVKEKELYLFLCMTEEYIDGLHYTHDLILSSELQERSRYSVVSNLNNMRHSIENVAIKLLPSYIDTEYEKIISLFAVSFIEDSFNGCISNHIYNSY